MKLLKIIFLIPYLIYADPPAIGNFSLPTSQQITPLVSFGQNILDKGNLQTFVFADAFIGKDNYSTDVIPSILYGITDTLCIFINTPFSPASADENSHSSGIEDIFAQLEYSFYAKNSSSFEDLGSIVAKIAFPTGSDIKNPPTGFGATSFFLGATLNRTYINWFYYTSPGIVLPLYNHGTKFGNQFLYQLGVGRNFATPPGWIFAWQIELDGTFSWKNKIKNFIDIDSGGNIIYATPSIWISSKKIIIQFGVGYPIVQHLFGNQSKEFLSFDFNFGFTF